MPSPTEGRASAQTGARGATDCRALIVGVAVSPLAAHRAPPAQPLVGPFAVQSAASLLTAADPAPALPPVGRYMLDSLLRFRMWCLGELFDPCRRPRRNASIACRSLLPAPFPDQWSFPPPALPGLIGTTTPSATPRGRLRASRHNRWPAPLRQPPPGASRVAHGPSTRMPSPLPRRNRWVRTSFSFPNGGGLPRISGGSASALPFSRPAQRSLLVTACALAESLTDPFTSEASSASLPPRTFRLLPAGTTLAGWDLHPLRPCTFARRTEMSGLDDLSRRTARDDAAVGSLTSVIDHLNGMPRGVTRWMTRAYATGLRGLHWDETPVACPPCADALNPGWPGE